MDEQKCTACGNDLDNHYTTFDAKGCAVAGSWIDGWTQIICATGDVIAHPKPDDVGTGQEGACQGEATPHTVSGEESEVMRQARDSQWQYLKYLSDEARAEDATR